MRQDLPKTAVRTFLTLSLIIVAGCVGQDRVDMQNAAVPTADSVVLNESEDKFDLVFLDEWADGKPVSVKVGAIGKRYKEEPKTIKPDEGTKLHPLSRMHPLVEQWLTTKAADDMVEVIVSVKEYDC